MYGNDLATIHHEGFGGFAKRATPGLLAMLASARIPSGGQVVDLGCGSGIWLAALERAGYATTGIDASRAMIRIARTVARRAHLRIGSAHTAAIPACDAVTAMGEVLSYGPARGLHPALPKLIRRVAGALSPRGLFVFDLLVRSQGPPYRYRSWREERSWAVLVDVHEDLRRRLLVRDIITFRRHGAAYRRTHERHRLRAYARGEVMRWLRAAGFTVRTARHYGDFALPPRCLAFIARKR